MRFDPGHGSPAEGFVELCVHTAEDKVKHEPHLHSWSPPKTAPCPKGSAGVRMLSNARRTEAARRVVMLMKCEYGEKEEPMKDFVNVGYFRGTGLILYFCSCLLIVFPTANLKKSHRDAVGIEPSR